MARAIVRYSINGESANQTGNVARQLLEGAGFDKVGTASFDAENIPQSVLLGTLRDLLTLMSNPPGGGTLDHIWIYLDEPEVPDIRPTGPPPDWSGS